jgi:PknH-like protein
MRRAALLWVCIAVAGCTNVIGGTVHPGASLGTTPATTTTTTSAPVVAATATKDKLLTLDELGRIVDDTNMAVKQTYSEPDSTNKPVDPSDCVYRMAMATAPAYWLPGRVAMAGDSDRGAKGNVAGQLIAVYADRSIPARVLGAAKVEWQACKADQLITITDGGGHWVADTMAVESTRIGTTLTRRERPPRTCRHVMATQANVVIETWVCGGGNTTDQANAIADKILAKVPN